MTDRYLALDVGGSKIESGLVTGEGDVLGAHGVPARPGCTLDELLADLAAALAPFVGEPVAGLGVGFPALGDYQRGVLLDSALFPAINGFPLRDHLSQAYGIPVKMTTDANLFALGIARFGEGRRYRDFLALSLGTGLGVGLIQNGRLQEGPRGVPEAALRIFQEPDGAPLRLAGHHFPRLYGADGETLAARAASGDAEALASFDAIGGALAETIRRLLAAYRVQAVVLGGGLCASWRFFAPAMERELGNISVEVLRTQLPYPALAGAAALFSD